MNASRHLLQAAMQCPDAVAIRYGDRTEDYSQFAQRASRLGGALLDLGLRPGDRVAIVQHNGPELLESIYGALLAGLVAVPINSRLHAKEVAYIASHSDSGAMLHTPEFNESLCQVMSSMPHGLRRISTAPSTGELDYEQLVANAQPLAGAAHRAPEDVAWLFYTSGTTGRPKGVIWTHQILEHLVLDYLADIESLRPSDLVLHAAPLSHGSGTVALAAIARAAQNVILDTGSFDPKTVFKLIETHRITNIAFIAPTQIVRMLQEFVPGEFDLSSLKCITYGGAPIYSEHLKRALEAFGPIFVQVFGQGEVPLTISYLHKDDHANFYRDGDGRLTSSGTARTSAEIAIADDDDNLLPVGERGQILVRGALVMPGYWANESATEQTLKNGWLHTGDIGELDEKGYLYVVDRIKDMVVSGGNNVYPREVEEVLTTHPSVAECVVFGIPDEYWGESVHAVVCLKEGTTASADELIQYCVANLASYKKPKTVEFMESLPKNAYGKVSKREVREPYWERYERRVGGGTSGATEIGGNE